MTMTHDAFSTFRESFFEASKKVDRPQNLAFVIRRRGACRLTNAMSSDEARAAETATGVSQDARFALELEFVMSLANPRYIHHLAKEKFLDDPSFVAYLAYLQYWREPRFCQYIVFPHCLRMLELLQQPSFRAALKRADFKDMVFRQQHDHWKHRLDAEPEDSAADGTGASEAGADGAGVAIGAPA